MFSVVTLKNPMEALDTLRARKGFFDLLLTDLHMPQLSGLQLQKQVMQEFKLPVISKYIYDLVHFEHKLSWLCFGLLQRPYANGDVC